MAKAVFFFALVFSLAVKLSNITEPFTGYFSSYQTLSGMVAKSFIHEGFRNLFLPQAFYILKGEPAIFLLFYPLDALIAGLLHQFLGMSVDFWGRMEGVVFSTLSLFVFYRIVKKLENNPAPAFLSSAFLALFPIGLVTGQCFINDNLALFFFLAGNLLIIVSGRSKFRLLMGSLFCSLAFVLRVHFLLLLPVVGAWIWQDSEPENRSGRILFSLLVCLILPLTWFTYIYFEGPRHVSLHTSLFMQAAEPRRFLMTLDFLEKFPRILWGIVLSPVGFSLAALGILAQPFDKKRFPIYLWFALSLLAAILLPQKTLDHPFYLLPLLPPAAYFGAQALEVFKKSTFPILGLSALISLHYAVGPIYGFLPKAPLILETSKALKQITQNSQTVMVSDSVMPYSLLYYSDRKGWIFFSPPEDDPLRGSEDLIRRFEEMNALRPASYYVMGDKKRFEKIEFFFNYLKDRYPVAYENEDLLIWNLQNRKA